MPAASPLLRWSMMAAGLAVTYAGFVLFAFPDRAADLFTWDIQPPVTAAFLGAMYASGTPLLFLVARPGTPWFKVRPVLPPFATVSVGMMAATALHADRFIWSSAVTWLWLVLYGAFPPLVVVLYRWHARRTTTDPPVRVPLAPRFRTGAWVIAAVLVVFGACLFAAPRTFDGLWPWPLTPLTARAIGSWLLSLGVALGAVARERDWEAVRLVAPQGILVSALLLGGAIRFADYLRWGDPQAWVYVGGVTTALIGGVLLFVALEGKRRRLSAVS